MIGGLAKVLLCLLFLIQPFVNNKYSSAEYNWLASPGSEQQQSNNLLDYELLEVIQFKPWELVTALAWSPKGDWIVLAAGDRLLAYNAESWELRWEYSLPALTSSLAFSRDGRWLAAGSRDGMVRVWASPDDLLGKGNLEPALTIEAHKKGVNCLAFEPGGSFLASGGNDSVARFWDLTTGENLGQMIGGTYAVPAIAFSPDGAVLAVVNGTDLRLREVGSERIVGTIQSNTPLFSVAYHPMDNLLITGSIENQVELWDASQAFRTGQETYPDPKRFSGHAGKPGTFRSLVWQVSFNARGDLLATAGGDALVRIWDVEKQELLATLPGHKLAVSSVAFAGEGHLLASGSLDASLRIWKPINP